MTLGSDFTRKYTVRKGVIKRFASTEECDVDWIMGKNGGVEKGRIIYEYPFSMYGCLSEGGIGVTNKPCETPAYQVPESAVKWTGEVVVEISYTHGGMETSGMKILSET